ncbi:hypothetical protein KAU11_00240 [Candidatus Babeliales bacterium]|nr:hypothetical protein [Candidatus Babeliales bacterium]
MKKEKVETKNGGVIDVVVYETLAEATKKLLEEGVLKAVNRQVRTDAVNEANRTMSTTAKLKRAVKDGKVTEAQLLALLK